MYMDTIVPVEGGSQIVKVKINFQGLGEEDITHVDPKYFIKEFRKRSCLDELTPQRESVYRTAIDFYELTDAYGGEVEDKGIFYTKDAKYKAFIVKFDERKKAKEFKKVFFKFYPSCVVTTEDDILFQWGY